MSSSLWFFLLTSPHSYPLPSFYLSFIFWLPHTSTLPLSVAALCASFFIACLGMSLRCHPGEVIVTVVVMHGSGRFQDRVVEETQASPSPSLSSSARWEEPNLSSVHPHQAGWQSQTHLLLILLINYIQAKGALRGRRLQRLLSTCLPNCKHTSQCSVFSTNHQCPPLVRAGGSLSSCL